MGSRSNPRKTKRANGCTRSPNRASAIYRPTSRRRVSRSSGGSCLSALQKSLSPPAVSDRARQKGSKLDNSVSSNSSAEIWIAADPLHTIS
jgi:hypothetical protein